VRNFAEYSEFMLPPGCSVAYHGSNLDCQFYPADESRRNRPKHP
jgi:hypothetical protein